MSQSNSSPSALRASIEEGLGRLMDLCEARRQRGENVATEAATLNRLAADIAAVAAH